MIRPAHLATLALLTVLSACGKPPAQSAPEPEKQPGASTQADRSATAPAVAPAGTPDSGKAPDDPECDAPREAPTGIPPTDREEGFPGVGTDLNGMPTLYLARVAADGHGVWRKPKPDSGSAWPLVPGHIVEVLSDRGPPAAVDGVERKSVPIRFGGLVGWTWANGLERLDAPPADGTVLWKTVAEALAGPGPGVPLDCPAALLVADLVPGGTQEIVVHSPGRMECRGSIGIFDVSEDRPLLLGSLALGDVSQLIPRAWGNGEVLFLDVTSYFMASQNLTGDFRTFYRVKDGKLAETFRTEASHIDSSGDPVHYRMCRFAFPDPEGNGRWLLQQRTTLRSISGGKESDEVSEEFFRFDGSTFVPTSRPEGIPDLPAEPPSIETGSGE